MKIGQKCTLIDTRRGSPSTRKRKAILLQKFVKFYLFRIQASRGNYRETIMLNDFETEGIKAQDEKGKLIEFNNRTPGRRK